MPLKMYECSECAASTAVSLIALLTPRSLDYSDKQYLLTEVSGLASEAAAIALMAGKSPYEAIRLLELGRGVIIGSLNDIRADISALQGKYPLLAEIFIKLRGQLDAPTRQDIRDLPGFGQFLSAPSETEVKAAAAFGPIVVIKTSDIRFQWLWDTIAKPVFDVLVRNNSPDSRWPRVWWIPTGPLAKFPIHAARYHSRSSDTVLDRVISSYSSSSRGLIQGRQNRAKTKAVPNPGKAVLVGMKELRYAPQEINNLEGLCRSMHLRVCKPQPCQSDVLAALDDLTDAIDASNTVKSLFGINLHNRKPFLAYLSACGTGQIAHEKLVDEGLHLIAACQLVRFQHVIGTLWKVNDHSAWTLQPRLMTGCKNKDSATNRSARGFTMQAGYFRGTKARKVDEMAMEQSRSSQDEAGELRDVVPCDDIPLYWVPYVHFGI
ncbi:hypothetical protein B0T26DRAFT_812436 [Lasiosphaeria miniovina]|uniref:CHAT domain-containing protein n=1 Tax=Lasiosphaeria miniovina TaxID=1954250 RepID=A0AA40E055_9PEZI|nr:uncharacterized protein B0T26DRAFT_812436 [Lasiosphaeria miniovina]KAK0717843.1 hypothetical protein B0T26DRAFT_812436 [Lasiosphaeria miniovina]